ncbi:hypothetical protein FKM82_021098, partial [Ascaphus truei]
MGKAKAWQERIRVTIETDCRKRKHFMRSNTYLDYWTPRPKPRFSNQEAGFTASKDQSVNTVLDVPLPETEVRERERETELRGPEPTGGPAEKMPVAVMAENSVNFQKLLEQTEEQELEAPGGIATLPVYTHLLALYLLHNDTNNARYLWKRIPSAMRSSSSELGGIWEVGQRIWQRDFPGVYASIAAKPWSENIQPVMEALR